MERVIAYKRLDRDLLRRLCTSDLTKCPGISTKQDVQVVSRCHFWAESKSMVFATNQHVALRSLSQGYDGPVA